MPRSRSTSASQRGCLRRHVRAGSVGSACASSTCRRDGHADRSVVGHLPSASSPPPPPAVAPTTPGRAPRVAPGDHFPRRRRRRGRIADAAAAAAATQHLLRRRRRRCATATQRSSSTPPSAGWSHASGRTQRLLLTVLIGGVAIGLLLAIVRLCVMTQEELGSLKPVRQGGEDSRGASLSERTRRMVKKAKKGSRTVKARGFQGPGSAALAPNGHRAARPDDRRRVLHVAAAGGR